MLQEVIIKKQAEIDVKKFKLKCNVWAVERELIMEYLFTPTL